jgi:hypothetical protein
VGGRVGGWEGGREGGGREVEREGWREGGREGEGRINLEQGEDHRRKKEELASRQPYCPNSEDLRTLLGPSPWRKSSRASVLLISRKESDVNLKTAIRKFLLRPRRDDAKKRDL